ncbi:TonB-dependent receptor [Chryseolinea sp. T2]|uniref:TonB-dependent receptor n=1 Tax=Chryseolinea sp. T2 TaxID=3129255 RepID=UPI003076B053
MPGLKSSTWKHPLTLLMIMGLTGLFLSAPTTAQQKVGDEWNVPYTMVGDSADLVEGSMVTVTGTIRGENGAPISGATISAESFKHFDHADADGRYILNMPTGRYRVAVRHLGYKHVYMRLRVISNGVVDITMEEGVTSLDEVTILSRAIDSNVKESLPGLNTLNVQEIKMLPTMMGEVDILKSLQLMPGVSSVGEGSSAFNVRGGRMDQNLVLLNNTPLFSTTHALGFVSAFNQDVLEDFSLYKGNVPAEYGGRASSVLQINTRRGAFDKWSLQGGIGPISSRIAVEGPIVPGKTSLLAAGRGSYANWVLHKANDPDVSNSDLSFYDGYLGLSHRFSTNSIADVSFYASHDDFRFSDQFGYRYNNYVVDARLQALADRKASPVFSLSYGHFSSTLIDPNGLDASELTNTMNYLVATENLNYEPSDKHAIVAGISGTGYFPQAERIRGINGATNVSQREVPKNNGIELAIYAGDDFKVTENFSVSFGLRYSYYAHLGPDTVFHYADGSPRLPNNIADTTYHDGGEVIQSFNGLEPRISARVSLTQNQSIKVSYNRMRQYIHLISNTTAPTPVDLWQVSNSYLPPQVADNYSIGYFLNLNNNAWETSAELFYKKMQNLVEYKDFAQLFLNNHLETELLTGRGRAYGGELYIRRLKGRLTGWISYTYTQTQVQVQGSDETTSINSGAWYASNYNKPHTFNFVLERKFKNNGSFSLIATYASGRPLTAIESSYIVNGTVIPVYSARNAYKMPDYFRVDASITVGNVFRKIEDSIVFSIYNLFGRENAYSVFYQRPAPNYFIPKPYKLAILGTALPSLTYNFKF